MQTGHNKGNVLLRGSVQGVICTRQNAAATALVLSLFSAPHLSRGDVQLQCKMDSDRPSRNKVAAVFGAVLVAFVVFMVLNEPWRAKGPFMGHTSILPEDDFIAKKFKFSDEMILTNTGEAFFPHNGASPAVPEHLFYCTKPGISVREKRAFCSHPCDLHPCHDACSHTLECIETYARGEHDFSSWGTFKAHHESVSHEKFGVFGSTPSYAPSEDPSKDPSEKQICVWRHVLQITILYSILDAFMYMYPRRLDPPLSEDVATLVSQRPAEEVKEEQQATA